MRWPGRVVAFAGLIAGACGTGCYISHSRPQDSDDPTEPAHADGTRPRAHDGSRDAHLEDATDAASTTGADAQAWTCNADGSAAGRVVSGLAVDLLFMIDNSGSMSEEQLSLSENVPHMVGVLATGDTDGDGTADFPAVADLHVGVVTSDMGSGGFEVEACTSTFGDDGVLQTHGGMASTCRDSYPTFLTYRAEAEAEAEGGTGVSELARDLSCVASVGTDGCSLEQPLEAVLKAVTPSSSPVRFFRNTVGHADRANAGFLREDSIFAAVLVTDEDDCSLRDPELADRASSRYEGGLDERCIEHESDALFPIDRYALGLRATRALHPERLVLAAIAGVPEDLVGDPAHIDYDAILGDARMQPAFYSTREGTRLRPSCAAYGRGSATPPRRIVRVARELGEGAIVQSICQPSFDGALAAITVKLASILRRVGCAPL